MFLAGMGFTDSYFANQRMNSEEFNRSVWIAAGNGDDLCTRWRMWGDLQTNYLKTGIAKSEVYQLLGRPKRETTNGNFGGGYKVAGVDDDAQCSYWGLGYCASFWASGENAVICWDDEDRLLKTDVWVWG